MARKCLIPSCSSNYGPRKGDSMKAKHYVRVFRFPKKAADMKVWSVKHWPENYPTVKLRGKEGPLNPPSVWPGVPESCIPTPRRLLHSGPLRENYSLSGLCSHAKWLNF